MRTEYVMCLGPYGHREGSRQRMGPRSPMGRSDLLYAITLPAKLAILKCEAHKTDGTFITRGNFVPDEAVRKAALGETQMMALVNPGEEEVRHPQEDNVERIVETQNEASEAEMAKWIARGMKRE